MDCLRAQQLISDALDSLAVDSAELASAKSHCRECETCAAFVRAQLAIRDAGLPAPPDDLVDRIMARVSAEAAAKSARPVPADDVPSTAFVSPATLSAAAAGADAAPSRTWTELVNRVRAPKNRRALVAWGSAAAVLFIAAGIGAIAGVRAILVPNQATETTVMGTITEDSTYGTADTQLTPSEERAGTAEESAESLNSAPSLITIDGAVYRLVGSAGEIDDSALQPVGTTTSSLDPGGREATYDVLGTEDASQVYIEVDRNEWLSFERVTRTYAGRLYVLKSGEISSFADWPTLPSNIDEPDSADGSPTFEVDGTDDAGTTIHHLRGSTAAQGIGLGPNPPAGDPIAGAPTWSWWEPAE